MKPDFRNFNTIFETTEEGPRGLGLDDKFLEERVLFLFDEVDEVSAHRIIQQMLYLDSVNNEPITLYLNTPGGCVVSGMAIMDVMQNIDSPVHTVALGYCCSMGFAILTRGDKRFASPSANIMAHQGSAGAVGNIQDMRVTMDWLDNLNEKMLDKIAEAIDIPRDEFVEKTKRDWWMTPQEALEVGVIDQIIVPKKCRKGKRDFKY